MQTDEKSKRHSWVFLLKSPWAIGLAFVGAWTGFNVAPTIIDLAGAWIFIPGSPPGHSMERATCFVFLALPMITLTGGMIGLAAGAVIGKNLSSRRLSESGDSDAS